MCRRPVSGAFVLYSPPIGLSSMTNTSDRGAVESGPPIAVLDTIAELASDTQAWLVDIWGVMHNGETPFPTAVAACQRFRAAGGVVLLLSNSPRPSNGVATQLDQIGVARDAYDGIVSSGDATRTLLRAWSGRPVFHLGPARDAPLFEGIDIRLVAEADADGVICTGLFDDTTETPEDYSALLASFKARDLPMICANPDIKVERGGRIIFCGGAVAQAYAEIGGEVHLAGKPHAPIYDMALDELARLRGDAVEKERILAIGDGVKTDIAGAVRAGIRAVYIASAVHMVGDTLDDDEISRLFPAGSERPVAAMAKLDW